ncbi:MAG: hypothetical protein MJ102_02000, partial [Clostridia bacterium]|nr:hypothetical protein [Clostridia bacterium]
TTTSTNAAFVNKAYDPTTAQFTVKKDFTGNGGSGSPTFAFDLYPANSSGTKTGSLIETKTTASFSNQTTTNQSKTVNFASISYNTAGTYYYRIEEKNGGISGIKYDNAWYLVTVVVSGDSANGKYTSTVTYKKNGTTTSTNAAFVNKAYDPTTVEIKFSETYYNHSVVGNETFTVKLYDSNSTAAKGNERTTGTASYTCTASDTKQNTLNQLLETITYTAPGTYYYLVDEIPGDRNYIVYDEAQYLVTVTVTPDDANARYQSTISYTKVGTAETHNLAEFYDYAYVKDQAVVIDYGLPVKVNALSYYSWGSQYKILGFCNAADIPAVRNRTDLASSSYANTYSAPYGTFSLSDNDTKVIYTPSEMEMEALDNVCVVVRFTDGSVTRYLYFIINVVPATTMYYEDNFSSVIYNPTTYNQWEVVGTHVSAFQSEDRPGAGHVYGYDPAYAGSIGHSLGGAHKITVYNGDYKDNGNNYATAQFTFTGTGFDIYSLTDKTTGAVLVNVYSGTDTTGTAVMNRVVDTYFGYSRTGSGYVRTEWSYVTDSKNPSDGGHWVGSSAIVDEIGTDGVERIPDDPDESATYVIYTTNYGWKVNDDNETLYQIPVVSETLTYGTYTVVITPVFAKFFDHLDTDTYDFYLDAIKIYSPANGAYDNSYYAQDDESAPEIIELRRSLVGGSTEGKVNGNVFIDSLPSTDDTEQYTLFGPNHEVYLAKNQSVSFTLGSNVDPDTIAGIYLGMKALNGDTTVRINGKASYTANSSTDMYYSIGQYVTNNKVITIVNTGDEIVSLTTLKVTFQPES